MASDRIKRSDIVEDQVLQIGTDYAKSLQAAIDKNQEWVKSFGPIKAAALEFNDLSKQFKVSKDQKEFLEIKRKEEQLTIAANNALKAEQQLLITIEKTKQASLATENSLQKTKQASLDTDKKKLDLKARELDITNKQLTITAKEEAAQKRKTVLSAKERVELQQRNLQAKRMATISSSLSTAYERESARLILLERRYKGVAVQYGVNSKEARKLQTELQQLRAKLHDVEKASGNFQRNVGNYPKFLGGAISSVTSLARAAGLLGGATLAFQVAKDVFNNIKEFNSGLLNVSKTAGITGKDLTALGQDIIQLSNKLGTVGTKTLLEYATVAGQLGVKGSANILAFSESLAKLETASDITGETGGASIARLLTLTDGGVQNVKDFSDELVKLGNNFAATESEILGNATAIAQNTGVYKLGRQQALAYAVATKAVGIESEITGSTIGKTLGMMEKAIRTGQGLEEISKLTGIAQKDLGTAFKENSGDVLQKFIKGLNEVDKAGGSVNAELEKLGVTAVRDQRVIGTLATAGYDTLAASMRDVADAAGSLDAEFKTASGKMKNQINRIGIAWDNFVLGIEDGKGFLGTAIKGFADSVVDEFDRANLMFNSNISLWDKIKVSVNNATGFFEDSTKVLIANTRGINDNTMALEAQAQAYADQHGSIGPLTKEQQALNAATSEYFSLIQSNTHVDGINADKTRTVADLRTEMKDLNDAIEKSDATDKKGVKIKQDKIKSLQRELDAILGVKKSTEDANKALEARLKLQRDDKFNLEKTVITTNIEKNVQISESDNEDTGPRLLALKKQTDDRIKLLDLEKERAIENAKDRVDELKRIELEYDNEFNEIIRKRESSTEAIIKDGFEKRKKRIEDEKQLQEDAINERIILEQKALENDLLGLSGNEKLIRIQAYENAVTQIKRDAIDAQLKDQIRLIEAELNNPMLKPEHRIALETMLKDARIALSNETTNAVIDNAEKEAEARRFLFELQQDYITRTSDNIGKALNMDAAKIEGFLDAFHAKTETTGNAVIDKYNEIASVLNKVAAATELVGEITTAIFQGRIDEIDAEMEKSDEYYSKLLDNENLSAEQTKALQKEQEQARKKLEKEKKEEQKKQAIAQKAAAAFTIGLMTAQAIIAALAPPPIGLGPIAGIPLAVTTGVLGGIQLAAVLAAPIPKYKDGTEFHPQDGPALVGEVRPEVIQEPGKNPYIVDRPTILDLPRGTKVTPSLEEYQRLMRASILTSVHLDNKKISDFNANQTFHFNDEKLIYEMRKNTEAIKKQKPTIHIHEREMNFDDALRRMNQFKWHN